MVMISEQREAYRQEDVLTINATKPQPSAPRPLAKNLNLTARNAIARKRDTNADTQCIRSGKLIYVQSYYSQSLPYPMRPGTPNSWNATFMLLVDAKGAAVKIPATRISIRKVAEQHACQKSDLRCRCRGACQRRSIIPNAWLPAGKEDKSCAPRKRQSMVIKVIRKSKEIQ
jgi:hypothetical protein